jgi:hypothetical protein
MTGLRDFLGYLDRDETPPRSVLDLPNLDKYYECKDEVVIADENIIAQVQALASLKNSTKINSDVKEVMAQAEFQIKEYMNVRDVLVDQDGNQLFTWKRSKDKTIVDWESIASAVESKYSTSEWKQLVEANTITKQGTRTFLCKLKG